MKEKRTIAVNYINITEEKVYFNDDLTFIKILNGSVILRKEKEPMELKKNDIIAVHRHSCFTLSPSKGHNLVAFLSLDTLICRTYEVKVGTRCYYVNSSKYEKLYPEIYHKLRIELEAVTRTEIFENKKLLHQHLKEIFELLIKHFNLITCGIQHKQFSRTMQSRYSSIFQTFFRLGNQSSLREISDTFSLNYDHLRKDFKKRFGLTFGELRDDFRVNKSLHYLFQTSLPITEVVKRVGFSDHKYMASAFRRRFDRTPSEMRRMDLVTADEFMIYSKSF